uniref:Retroviral polymerase SH3-like domain-containing protein n=1 Tax=Lactuca sativa TaxID=4236 RepID=A0A9R1VS11_LACSA|nr:hypothetical protein LSAT_V11C400189870 [Lactuca sativa]
MIQALYHQKKDQGEKDPDLQAYKCLLFAHKAQTRVRVSRMGVGEVEAKNELGVAKLRGLNMEQPMKIGARFTPKPNRRLTSLTIDQTIIDNPKSSNSDNHKSSDPSTTINNPTHRFCSSFFSLALVFHILFGCTMALIAAFTTAEKTSHNSHKFGFTLSPTNYGFWKTMIHPFLVTNNLIRYVDGTIPCPSPVVEQTSSSDKGLVTTSQPKANYPIWVSNDAHVRMLIISTISEAALSHVQGTSTSREMNGDETSSAYLNRAKEYADALANIGEPFKEKDLVMLVPTSFNELNGLLSDHDYMIKQSIPVFHTNATGTTSATIPLQQDSMQALTQLVSQLGFKLQPANQQPQAFFTSSSPNNRSRGRFPNNRGRGRNPNNRNSRGQFTWDSNQNTVYGTCNRCGIGHLPSDCPNRDPSTFRNRQPPLANHADHVVPDHSSIGTTEPYYGDESLHDEISHNTLLTGPSEHRLYSFQLPSFQPVSRSVFTAVRAPVIHGINGLVIHMHISCVFRGYSPDHHGYRCLDPTSDRIYIARHVRFVEQQFPFLQPSPIPPTTPSPDPYISSYPTIIPSSDNPINTTTPPTPPIILNKTPSTSSSPSTVLDNEPTSTTEPTSPPPVQSTITFSVQPEPSTRVRTSHLRQNPKPRVP